MPTAGRDVQNTTDRDANRLARNEGETIRKANSSLYGTVVS
jgi:hypothetical protein